MEPLSNKPADTTSHILSLADRCVKCGLCLPQCPTYALTENENESPRGRIALIQGWLNGQLLPSKTLEQHLDQCLLCRRCERVCPSVVPFGEIMDQSKALLVEKTKSKTSILKNISLKLLLNKATSGYLISTLRLLQKMGIIALIKKSGLLKLVGLQRLISYLPKLDKPLKTKTFYPADTIYKQQAKGNIALFTGCLSKQLDPNTVNASIKLLNHLGYGVYIPQQQVCCGALHFHEGNTKQAVNYANNNINVFNQQEDISAIVSLVNGCTSQLREYSQQETSGTFKTEVKDIIEFLAEINWPENVKFEPLDKKATVQIPCSLQNILRADEKLLSLLKRIPDLSPDTIYNRCCGAAGSYFINHPQISDQLKEQAITVLNKTSPEVIISSNLGCALQLKSGLSQNNDAIKVIHPVELLEQQLKLN